MLNRKVLMLCAAAMTVAFAGAAYAGAVQAPDDDEDDLRPTGKGWGERAFKDDKSTYKAPKDANKSKTSSTGINYHGGPVMLGQTNVYYIWYGNWSGNTAQAILTDLANNIGGSPYFNINTTYYDGSNRHVSNAVH